MLFFRPRQIIKQLNYTSCCSHNWNLSILALHKKWSLPLRVSSVNMTNPQFLADFVSFTQKVLNEKLYFWCGAGYFICLLYQLCKVLLRNISLFNLGVNLLPQFCEISNFLCNFLMLLIFFAHMTSLFWLLMSVSLKKHYQGFEGFNVPGTAWKLSKYVVFLVCIFLYSDWIRRFTSKISVRVKSAQIRVFFWPVFSCIWTRKTSVFGHISRSVITLI